MDEQQKSPTAEDAARQWREQGARYGEAGYWLNHEIVRRSDDEVRRGEAPAYVRRIR